MQNKFHLLLLLFTLISNILFSINIKGKVVDENNDPLVSANIIIRNLADSSLIKVDYTKGDGKFDFQFNSGDFFFEVSYVGMHTYLSPMIPSSKLCDVGTIVLHPNSTLLDGAVVNAQIPLITIQDDKTIFNIEGNTNVAGNNGIELISKAPGVFVSLDNKIVMGGKSGASIYVDGRKVEIPEEQLVNYLSSLNSENIKSIELIHNPSAKFDASGNAGVINIIKKKSKDNGWFLTSYVINDYGHKYRLISGLSSFFKTDKINFVVSIKPIIGNIDYDSQSKRVTANKYLESKFNKTRGPKNISTEIILDYHFNDKNTISLKHGFYNYPGNVKITSSDNVYDKASRELDFLMLGENDFEFNKLHNTFNLAYLLNPTKRIKITTNFNYGKFSYLNTSNQINKFFKRDKKDNFKTNTYKSASISNIEIFSGNIDFSTFILQGEFDFGYKGSLVNSDNIFKQYTLIEQFQLDTNRSNQFKYIEKIHAGYLSYSKKITKKIKSNIGLRIETTDNLGKSLTISEKTLNTNNKNSIDWFPSFNITYNINPKNKLAFNYGKRINRPNYQALNSFVIQYNEFNFYQGNSFLKSEYSHNLNLKYVYNRKYLFNISYSKITNMIGKTLFVNNYSTYDSWGNITNVDLINLEINLPIDVTKWWTISNSISGSFQNKQLTVESQIGIDTSLFSFVIKSQNHFILPNNFSVQTSFSYFSKNIYEANFFIDRIWNIDLGIKKKFFNGRCSAKLTFLDIFKTKNYVINSKFLDNEYKYTTNIESRRIRLTISYYFGNKKSRTKKRKSGIENEISRTKGND